MILLDENITDDQKVLLEKWRLKVKKVGKDVLFKGILDDPIIKYLHQQSYVDFFTRDNDFFNDKYCHLKYSIIHIEVAQGEAAYYIRKLLKHHYFNTKNKRKGKVIKISQTLISFFFTKNTPMLQLKW